ncbi:SDR family NAD(P)-dependent oxidoreductase [Sphingomonas sp. RP10(2022)]|uniref:SDR family NAD(P)-dependent oxidoreductase n=1 Tax=Sphingomonas liriopis TaxID=2949094 RepID=A0A9X2HZS7_9SPHN|nr:SDR family NAD(P)-dependent oxidoreductase [Sphingomonas liriopis]MCP3735875.1 SDR family NAD(P)-dependent oxidoreductase [Sphingomonas liriopis]
MSREQELFEGGVAVITGAGAGIGMGLARRCGEIGMTVIVTDIEEARARSVADAIMAAGGRSEAQRLDVADPAALDAFAADVFARHGEVRLLVNNAGIETLGLTWEIPAARWEQTLSVNINGIVHGVRAFVPHMLKAGKQAWIANLASVGAFGQMPTQTAYIMSKHAIQAFSECLYLEMEVAGAPIHVSSVIPGMLKTSIFDAAAGKGEPEGAARHRAKMAHMMANYGMDLDEGCHKIIAKIAAGEFWVDTQEQMTDDIVAGRVAFLQSRAAPAMGAETKALLED